VRSYDLTELEEMSALSRRTISDYVSRGLLSGPSHRGRGARYSQRDLDALRVIPRLRTVLKPEFPNLNAVREFLARLTSSDLRHLVRLSNERVFEIEVRRIRILNRLRTFLPAVPPEALADALARLTPEQICGVDRGQIQIGSLIDVDRLAGRDERADRLLYAEPSDPAARSNGGDGRWERFGNSTVQVRIEKEALGKVKAGPTLSQTIRDFAEQIESLLKPSG
jgi:DNA-binding transcriptional MerR regulator